MIARALPRSRLALASAAASVVALWIAALIVRAPLADLAAARADHARHELIAARPFTPPARALPVGQMMGGRTPAAASAALAGLIRKRALAAGLLIEALDPRPDAAAAEASLTVSGSEAALLRFVADTEADRPLIRFRSWRFVSGPDGGVVRLNAIAVTPWSDEA